MKYEANIFPEMSAEAFRTIATLAYNSWGLVLAPEKRAMVASRLRNRLNACGLSGFDEYSDYVRSEVGRAELIHMVSALTTNVSHFFREEHHFDLLVRELRPKIKSEIEKEGKIRIWSAGCSNGQEPYSIVMRLLDKIPEIENVDFKLLATDINPNVVKFARTGNFEESMLKGITNTYRDRFTSKSEEGAKMRKAVQKYIKFKQLNLLETWPMKGSFQGIFCRNVVIYFDQKTQKKMWSRFHECLTPNGVLFLGHSERIQDHEDSGYSAIGATAFRKSGHRAPEKTERNFHGTA